MLSSRPEVPALVHDAQMEHLVYQEVPFRVRKKLVYSREGYFMARWNWTKWTIGPHVEEGE